MTEDRIEIVEEEVTFARYLLADWTHALHQFFQKVELASERWDMTADEVNTALRLGYGDEIADAWEAWVSDE
jgi:hypothetical protein